MVDKEKVADDIISHEQEQKEGGEYDDEQYPEASDKVKYVLLFEGGDPEEKSFTKRRTLKCECGTAAS